VPESIVFLENHGKPEKAEKISKKLQEKRPSTKESRALLDDKTEDGEFKYLVPPLLHLILIWTNIMVLFQAQVFFAGVVTDNPFLSTYLMTVIDVVAYLVTPFMNKIFKRKSVLLVYFVILSVVSLAGIFNGPKLLCFLLSRMGTSALYGTITLLANEMFPTSVRSKCLCTAVGCATFSSFFSPFIGYSSKINPVLPFIIFMIIGVISMLFVVLLPDTSEKTELERFSTSCQFYYEHYTKICCFLCRPCTKTQIGKQGLEGHH